MFKVKYLIQEKGKTIGAELQSVQNNEVRAVDKRVFIYYMGRLTNATVTKNGVMRGVGCKLETMDLSKYKPIELKDSSKITKVTEYTIMYESRKVIKYNTETDKITIYEKDYLPYSLRNQKPLYGSHIILWLTDRIANIDRTYMNMVYIARKVGRDRNRVIQDSAAISITDNYWVKTKDIGTTWDEIKELRDVNNAITEVALTGKLIAGSNEGITSLFTIKGYFPKGILGGYMYKLKEDAILEYPAYLLGLQLGIKTSECSIEQELIKIKLFTNYKTSLVHASELKKYYDVELVYNALIPQKRYDLMGQMQRLYIFNYIIGNPDLHEDNYGFLYNAETFEIKELAPCYDHNVAFSEGFQGVTRETQNSSQIVELDKLAEMFIPNHKDILEKLKILDLEEVSKYLTRIQLRQLKERIENVIAWGK